MKIPRWWIVAAVAFIMFESAMIIYMLVNPTSGTGQEPPGQSSLP